MRVWFPSWFTACFWLCVVAFAREVGAQAEHPSENQVRDLALERYVLANGLRVVLDPVPGRTATAVCITYVAGSGLEPEGQSGIASLVAQLMTQGSRNVEPNEHGRLLTERGAVGDTVTTEEVASYCTEAVPTELPLLFWLEADRMGQLALNKDSFEHERALFLDEHRERFGQDAYQRGSTRLHELVFQRYWPYEHPPRGFRPDVATAEYTQAKAFVSDYYSPDNAVISVVGSFDEADVRTLIDRYFASLPRTARKPQSASPPLATLARQTSERLSVLEQRSLTAPIVYYGWRIPAANTREARALELAAQILGNAQTGRLRTDLLETESLARDVECSTYRLRDAGIIRIGVTLHRRSTVDAMQKALEKQLLSLKLSGPSLPEVEAAKVALAAKRRTTGASVLARSRELGRLEGVFGDPSLFDKEDDAFASLTPSDVRAAMAKYMLDTRRSIVELYPHGWVRDIGPPVITKTYIVQPGDNLTRIAARYGTTPEQLAKQNGLVLSKRITVGQRLLITTNPAKIVKVITHTVAKGQTLIAIGKKYGVSAEDVAKANGLTTKKSIRPGQVLQIPPKPKLPSNVDPKSSQAPSTASKTPVASTKAPTSGTSKPDPKAVPGTRGDKSQPTSKSSPAPTTSPAKPSASKPDTTKPEKEPVKADAPPVRTYVVKPGDSLSVIAHKFKVSVPALTRANGLSKKKPIRPGQKLIIPQ